MDRNLLDSYKASDEMRGSSELPGQITLPHILERGVPLPVEFSGAHYEPRSWVRVVQGVKRGPALPYTHDLQEVEVPAVLHVAEHPARVHQRLVITLKHLRDRVVDTDVAGCQTDSSGHYSSSRRSHTERGGSAGGSGGLNLRFRTSSGLKVTLSRGWNRRDCTPARLNCGCLGGGKTRSISVLPREATYVNAVPRTSTDSPLGRLGAFRSETSRTAS